VLLALAAAVYSLLRASPYTAEAAVRVSSQDSSSMGASPRTFLQEVMGTVGTDRVSRKTMKKVGWKGSRKSFENQLDVQPFLSRSGDSGGLRVTFSSYRARKAALVANTYARLFADQVDELGKEKLVGASLDARAEVAERATPPEAGRVPGILLHVGVAAAAGLAVGLAAARFLEGRSGGWPDVRDAEALLKVPVLGAIPEYRDPEREEARSR
jgi:capsular polysaccharide biosynthesis protein